MLLPTKTNLSNSQIILAVHTLFATALRHTLPLSVCCSHLFDISLSCDVMIHNRSGVILPDDTSCCLLYTTGRRPWLINILLWVLLQLGQIFPKIQNESWYFTGNSKIFWSLGCFICIKAIHTRFSLEPFWKSRGDGQIKK